MATTLACRCGAPPANATLPFSCVLRGQDPREHVLVRRLDAPLPLPTGSPSGNPFLRYRHRLHSYTRALAAGWDDARFVAMVRGLDDAVAQVDGRGFRVTPYAQRTALGDAAEGLGQLWVKDETGNVSGSHKARHLMGVALHLEVAGVPRDTPLAIASCGNAALAAAVVARGAQRPLRVYIPPDANPAVVARLESLGAQLNVCERGPDTPPGDPCYHGFLAAVQAGALPFTCQGPDNGLTIEGGMTLGWELAEQMREAPIDVLFVQVGGAALASAVAAGLQEAVDAGDLAKLPRLVLVQTRAAWPLARAWQRLQAHIDTGATPAEALAWAGTHRSELMWPWEEAPHSVAHGILDDETYDWFAAVEGMLHSGGQPVVVDEPTLIRANTLARTHTDIPVDPTGSSGLAGALAMVEPLEGERVGVLFTGVER